MSTPSLVRTPGGFGSGTTDSGPISGSDAGMSGPSPPVSGTEAEVGLDPGEMALDLTWSMRLLHNCLSSVSSKYESGPS